VLYVDKNISDGFWQDSYSELNAALSEAREGDEIWVATGTYFPGGDRNGSFVLKAGIKTYGGFFGGETSRKDRDWVKNPTILSGDIGVIGDYLDNSKHIVCYDGVLDKETVLDGFIIRDGYADNGSNGAGMHLTGGAEPGILNCHFVNNISSGAGGAVHIKNGPLFEQCLFESNFAEKGAAIYSPEDKNQYGTAVFSRCTFVLNRAAEGSAMYIDKRQSAQVDSSIFWNNTNSSGQVSSFYLNTSGASNTALSSIACDDTVIDLQPSRMADIIYYSSQETDGPFKDTEDYPIDKKHNIPQEYGWYFVPSPLVLNIRVFLEGPM
jgi:predicted outer membrane repeat protein